MIARAVFAVEGAGVEDCNNADSDQVINHRQGKKEDAHCRGQERSHARNTATAKAMSVAVGIAQPGV